MLKVSLYDYDSKFDELLTRVVIVCRFKNKWLLCKHREKGSWEIPGGHIELGESWREAAKRELFEETGITKYNIEKICLYKISTYGLLCFAEVLELSNNYLIHEMDEISLFDDLPLNMTYYETHKLFIDKVCEIKNF